MKDTIDRIERALKLVRQCVNELKAMDSNAAEAEAIDDLELATGWMEEKVAQLNARSREKSERSEAMMMM